MKHTHVEWLRHLPVLEIACRCVRQMHWYNWMLILIVCVSIFSCSFSVRMQCITKQCLAQFLTGFALYKFSSSLLWLNSWSLDQQLLNWWILVRMSCSWSVSKSAPCCLQRDAALDYMSVSLCLYVSVSVRHHVCVCLCPCASPHFVCSKFCIISCWV